MNDDAAFEYIQTYFHRLFVERDISALDEYLHPDYWDDDIGESGISHIDDSKIFLSNLFKRHPNINVNVENVMCNENVITACLRWVDQHDGHQETLRKGIAVFVLVEHRILKRHTYIFFDKDKI